MMPIFRKITLFQAVFLVLFILAGCATEHEKEYALTHGCEPKNGVCYYPLPEGVKDFRGKNLDSYISDEVGERLFSECSISPDKTKIIKIAEPIPPEVASTGWHWTKSLHLCDSVYFITYFSSSTGINELYGPFDVKK